MQTFCSERPLQHDPGFEAAKARALESMDMAEIDEPIKDVIASLNKHPSCYTLQSCFGHFVSTEHPDDHNLSVVEESGSSDSPLYRISYLALCIRDNSDGRRFLSLLKRIPWEIDRDRIQFGCAEWFWNRCINSYVLQVQPKDRADVDSLTISVREVRLIQSARNHFWDTLRTTLDTELPS